MGPKDRLAPLRQLEEALLLRQFQDYTFFNVEISTLNAVTKKRKAMLPIDAVPYLEQSRKLVHVDELHLVVHCNPNGVRS